MIKLAEPDIGHEELEEIKEVIESKHLVQGKKVEELEKMAEEYLGIKHAIAVSSGTAALHLALIVLGIKPGDEVIVPDFTFPATCNVVEVIGADVKFADISLHDFCMDVNLIEHAVSRRTKAIIPVHEFGCPADMEKIIKISEKYGLQVIEDAACALGTMCHAKMAGTIGKIGCFSLHPRKAVTTGEGGILATNDDEAAERLRTLRNHGICYKNGSADFTAAGLNYRMTDIQGAIGIVQMRKLTKILEARKKLARMYNELLEGHEYIAAPQEPCSGTHVYQTYHILLDKKVDRQKVIHGLREKGIETNIGAYAVHMQSYYRKKYGYPDSQFPNAVHAYRHGLALPLHVHMTGDHVSYIVETLDKLVRSC